AAGAFQIAVPAAIAAIVLALPDLLSCRAAGMLLVLVPSLLLSAAQWHPSPARYLPIAVGYAMAVEGMFAVARPWTLRDQIARANATPARTRAVSAFFLAVAAALLLCAAFFFPVSSDTLPLH
ncbi:MAG: hypothetical protein IJ678_03390, partial [Kiritimatiellae bacterium]|nr:hypothetical protein [Kiritimatiellia bacterium]